MDNDITYVVVVTAGTISLMCIVFTKHIFQKFMCITVASIMFTQAGVCVYRGVNGLHRKKKDEAALAGRR